MLARDRRLDTALRCWLVALALSGAVGLVFDGWLWAPVAVAGVRGVVMIVLWGRLEGARWWSRRTERVRVFAAVPRRQVQVGAHGGSAWGDQLVGGVLDASDDHWAWRPFASGGSDGRLAVHGADAVAVLSTRAHDPGMPPADYVRVMRRQGEDVELLVWDFGRLPQLLQAHPTLP
jgi:hypothetical protein